MSKSANRNAHRHLLSGSLASFGMPTEAQSHCHPVSSVPRSVKGIKSAFSFPLLLFSPSHLIIMAIIDTTPIDPTAPPKKKSVSYTNLALGAGEYFFFFEYQRRVGERPVCHGNCYGGRYCQIRNDKTQRTNSKLRVV